MNPSKKPNFVGNWKKCGIIIKTLIQSIYVSDETIKVEAIFFHFI